METSKHPLTSCFYLFLLFFSYSQTASAAAPATPLASDEQLASYVDIVDKNASICSSLLGASGPCWEISVSCVDPDGVNLIPRTGHISFGNSVQRPVQGLIMLLGGGNGTGFWESGNDDTSAAIFELNQAGFQTAQLKWDGSWMFAQTGDAVDGHASLACPAAAVAAFLEKKFVASSSNRAFCVTGNSGGAAQASYMLSHYGLDPEIDFAVMTSGPPLGRMDYGCLLTNGADQYTYPEEFAVGAINDGFLGDISPCSDTMAEGVGPSLEILRNASVSYGGNYLYPTTDLAFIFGSDDTSGSVAQGLTYSSAMVEARHGRVSTNILPGVGHSLHLSPEGAAEITDELLARCLVLDE